MDTLSLNYLNISFIFAAMAVPSFLSDSAVRCAPIFGPGDESVTQLGLNSEPVARALRGAAFPTRPTGAAHVKLVPGLNSQNLAKDGSVGILVLLVQPMQALQQSGWQELSPRLACYEVTADGGKPVVEDEQKRILLRALFQASPRIKPPADQKLISALTASELSLFQELRRPSDEQIAAGIRNAVTPLFAGIVSD